MYLIVQFRGTVHFIKKFTFLDHVYDYNYKLLRKILRRNYDYITITLRLHYDYKLLRNVLRRNYDTIHT